MFTIIAAFAKFERDIISERVKFGIEKAKANGKQIGRPSKEVDSGYLLSLRQQGMNYRDIAKMSGISLALVHKIINN
jgi:DNA invertase Pin-like site-specific DNA recombinase